MGPGVRGWQGQSLTRHPSASAQPTISQSLEGKTKNWKEGEGKQAMDKELARFKEGGREKKEGSTDQKWCTSSLSARPLTPTRSCHANVEAAHFWF